MLRQGERWKRGKEVVGSRKPIQQVLRAWKGAGVQGVVWDHAAFPQGEGGGRGEGRPMLLSPAERVFTEVRRWVEGRRYECIEAKKAAVEAVPRRLEAEGKVSSLLGWRHIRQALNALLS
jgi:hypothetical protein